MKKVLFLSLVFTLSTIIGFSQGTWQVSNITSPVSSYRGGTAVYSGSDQHMMYVFGGWATSSGNFDETSIYDFINDSWTTGPNVPENTKGGAAICIDDNIYLLTGNDGADNDINSQTFLKYNVLSESWDNLAEYPIAARYVAMAYNPVNGLIYCAGGSGDYYEAVDQVNAYDPESDSWISCTSLPFISSGGSALIFEGNHLYLIGGMINQPYDKLFKGLINIDDPADITWSPGTSIPIEMAKISAGYLGNGQIIATGLNGTFLYDISLDSWSEPDGKPNLVKGGNYVSIMVDDIYNFAVAGGKDVGDNLIDHVEYIPGDENVKFPATFVLTSVTGEPIENAEILVSSYMIQTDEAGSAVQYLENGTYDYTANYDDWVANGSFTIDGEGEYIEALLLTSINEYRSGFVIYPNPVHGIFKLQGVGNSTIEVCDLKGKMIYTGQAIENNFSIDLSQFKPGLYLLKIKSDDGYISMRKIILK